MSEIESIGALPTNKSPSHTAVPRPRVLMGSDGEIVYSVPHGKGAPGCISVPLHSSMRTQRGISKEAVRVSMAGRQDASFVDPAELGTDVDPGERIQALWNDEHFPGGHIRDDNCTFATTTDWRRPPRGGSWENEEMADFLKQIRRKLNELIAAGKLHCTTLFSDIRTLKPAGGKAGYQKYRVPTSNLLMETSQLLHEALYDLKVGERSLYLVDIDTKADLAATMCRDRVLAVLQQNGYPGARYVPAEGKVKVTMPWGEFYVYDRVWAKLVQASVVQDVGTGAHEFINAKDPEEYEQMQNQLVLTRGWLRVEARFVIRRYDRAEDMYVLNEAGEPFTEAETRRDFVDSILPLLQEPHYRASPGAPPMHSVNYTSLERHIAATDLIIQRAGDEAAVFVFFDPSVQESRVDRVNAYLRDQKAPCHPSAVPSILAPYDGAKAKIDFDEVPAGLVVWTQTSANKDLQGFFVRGYQNRNTDPNAAFESLLQGISACITVDTRVLIATALNGFKNRFGTAPGAPDHVPLRAALRMCVREYTMVPDPRAVPGMLVKWAPGGWNNPCEPPRNRAHREKEQQHLPKQPRWSWEDVGVGAPNSEDPPRKHFLFADWPAQPGHGRIVLPPSLQNRGTLRYLPPKDFQRRHLDKMKVFSCQNGGGKARRESQA